MSEIYTLTDRMRARRDLVLRDDETEFAVLLDAARRCREKKCRFKVLDTGRFSASEVEWLVEAGAHFYSSDEVKREVQELIRISKTASKEGTVTAYLRNGPIQAESKTKDFDIGALSELGRNGVRLYISSREKPREFPHLSELASSSSQGGTQLVYYHHGPVAPELAGLSGLGTWVHLSDTSLGDPDSLSLLAEILKSKEARPSRLILHVERGLAFDAVKDLMTAPIKVIFKTPPSDYKSPFRALEREARRRKIDWRAFYLQAAFTP